MKCQEVRDGETIISIIRSILVLAAIATTATDPNKINLRTAQQGKQWGQKPKDSKITLTQELAHYVPTELSSSFFRQFDLVMKLKREELKEARKKQQSGKQDY